MVERFGSFFHIFAGHNCHVALLPSAGAALGKRNVVWRQRLLVLAQTPLRRGCTCMCTCRAEHVDVRAMHLLKPVSVPHLPA